MSDSASNQRFNELLEKGRTNRLNPAEIEELAHFLNAPILDPLTNQLLGFVSKHTFAPSDVVGRLRQIDWFSHVGEHLSYDLSMSVEPVSSWPQAIERCSDGVWEYVELEAQNQLTMWLHENDRKRFQNWNALTSEHKASVLKDLTNEQWIPYQQKHGLDAVMIHSVQWDVLAALMENSYLSSEHRCCFFLELLTVYEAGHFPCGWRGEWPAGKLVVY